ncbi:MAG: hypothetical protein KAT56_10680, partial [Sedimentisphaerales bacterium]|nr:hypothetical protein [Sedimentisphaerales bacterium]
VAEDEIKCATAILAVFYYVLYIVSRRHTGDIRFPQQQLTIRCFLKDSDFPAKGNKKRIRYVGIYTHRVWEFPRAKP